MSGQVTQSGAAAARAAGQQRVSRVRERIGEDGWLRAPDGRMQAQLAGLGHLPAAVTLASPPPAATRRGPAARRRPAMIELAAFEEIIDASGAAPRIEAMLPAGARRRQLSARTMLAGLPVACLNYVGAQAVS